MIRRRLLGILLVMIFMGSSLFGTNICEADTGSLGQAKPKERLAILNRLMSSIDTMESGYLREGIKAVAASSYLELGDYERALGLADSLKSDLDKVALYVDTAVRLKAEGNNPGSERLIKRILGTVLYEDSKRSEAVVIYDPDWDLGSIAYSGLDGRLNDLVGQYGNKHQNKLIFTAVRMMGNPSCAVDSLSLAAEGIGNEDWDHVEELLKQIFQTVQTNPDVFLREMSYSHFVRVYCKYGQFDQALRLGESIQDPIIRDIALQGIITQLLAKGAVDQAIIIAEKIHFAWNYQSIQWTLMCKLIDKGRFDDAMNLTASLSGNYDQPGRANFISKLIEKNYLDEAERLTIDLLDNPELLNGVILKLIAAGRQENALRMATHIRDPKKKVFIYVKAAVEYGAQGNLAKAKKLYKQVEKMAGEERSIWAIIGNAMVEIKDYNRPVKLLGTFEDLLAAISLQAVKRGNYTWAAEAIIQVKGNQRNWFLDDMVSTCLEVNQVEPALRFAELYDTYFGKDWGLLMIVKNTVGSGQLQLASDTADKINEGRMKNEALFVIKQATDLQKQQEIIQKANDRKFKAALEQAAMLEVPDLRAETLAAIAEFLAKDGQTPKALEVFAEAVRSEGLTNQDAVYIRIADRYLNAGFPKEAVLLAEKMDYFVNKDEVLAKVVVHYLKQSDFKQAVSIADQIQDFTGRYQMTKEVVSFIEWI